MNWAYRGGQEWDDQDQVRSKKDKGKTDGRNVSIKSLNSEIREAHGRGGRKNVRTRGDEVHQENKDSK